jgi:hypothetical protein
VIILFGLYTKELRGLQIRFAFDSSLFQINTPFVRLLCINKDNTLPARKRRKKRRSGIVNTDMKDVNICPVVVL